MNFSHVLISRPAPEAAELAELVKSAGLVPVCLTAFAYEPAFAGLDFHNAWSDQSRRLAIFCSPRAVEFGLRQLPAGFLDEIEIAAIGPATADLLELAGHTVTILPKKEFNSESLLAHRALLERPGKALIFAAPGGRQHLYDSLAERNWEVEFAHVYCAVPITPETEDLEPLLHSSGVLSVWTSAKALDHLSRALDSRTWDILRRGAFILTSQRLANLAKNHFPASMHVTDGPGNDAIMRCILHLN
ncbi:MAG: uroporphyrinogen III methyltransferase/synthase [Lysobacterales bacterium]|jgi:uroporphyrinogen III methyltransferase/synthase